MAFSFDQVLVTTEAKEDPLSQRFLETINPSQLLVGQEKILKRRLKELSFKEGKRSLFLTESKGKLLKPCPGITPHHLCCNLKVLNTISNCPFFCSYCFLSGYLNNLVITVYPDLEKAKEEVEQAARSSPQVLLRVTTGELSDSLALDKRIPMARGLIEFFKNLKNALLELKTKSNQVNHLLSLNHQGRTVISWSLNTPKIIKEEEKGTASLKARLEAAVKAEAAGYLLGFHFDPLIYYPGWEEDYRSVVKFLFQKVSSSRIAWLSLGTLRFPPGTEEEIEKVYPHSKLPYGELVLTSEGKKRYFKPIRFELYQKMLSWIREYGGKEVFVYLCMETKKAWEKVMGKAPSSPAHLDFLFAQSLHQRFPEIFSETPRLENYISPSRQE